MKKPLSLLLALVMLFCACPLAGFAAGDHEHKGTLRSLRTEPEQETKFCGEFVCSLCRQSYYAPVTYKDVGMPIVNIDGSLDGISKDTEVIAKVSYSAADVSFESFAALHIQGFTSIRYEKKNYGIQFVQESGAKNKVLVRQDWGRQSKYCLKANWVDATHARNIVSARLFSEIVHSRGIDDEVDALLCGGAVDGFPVLLYQNGDFLGLYTFNMPKDHWIYGMEDDELRQGVLNGVWYTNVTALWETMDTPVDVAAEENGFELEYCSTAEPKGTQGYAQSVAWLGDSFNDFVQFLLDHDGQEFKETVEQYTTVERCIDYLLYMFFIGADDNHAQNIVWLTYDGHHFLPSAYDMDGTWGMKGDGTFDSIDSVKSYAPMARNSLYQRLLDNYAPEIRARYLELREDILSLHNIERQFAAFQKTIPAVVQQAERKRWPFVPNRDVNTFERIMEYAAAHAAYLDSYYGVTVHEKTDLAFRAAFLCSDAAAVSVFATPGATGEAQRAAAAYSVNAAGELTKNGGSIAFHVNAKNNHNALVSVSPANAYEALENLGGNDYRVTGITGDLEIRVSEGASDLNDGGYHVTFQCEDGLRVLVYPMQDYNLTPTEATSAVSVKAGTGVATKTDGQVNFKVVSDSEEDVFTVRAEPEDYKNIKGFEETGVPNVFRITRISGNLAVTVKRDSSHEHSYTLRYTAVNDDKAQHRAYCVCGKNLMQAHSFSKKMVTDNAVFTQHEYQVCDLCGFSIQQKVCTHMCHSTRPVVYVIWSFINIFNHLIGLKKYCDCGVAHY